MTEWIECVLSDIGEIVGGATPSTKDDSNYDGDIAWLTPKDLSTFTERYIKKGERSITEKGYKSCSTKILPANSVLFSSRAPIGYVAIAANEMCTNQGFKSIIPNEKVDYMFLYYLLKYKKSAIEGMGSGTTFKEVSGNVMKNIEVRIPKEKSVQKKIAEILDKIDSKIENNNMINRNLSEQLKAIFVETFGQEISNTKIGDGVDLGELIDVIDNRGKTPPLTTDTIEYPIIDVGALRGDIRVVDFNNCTKFVDEDTYNNWFRSGHPKPWDILLSTVGSLAEMKIFLGEKGCIAQNVVALRSKGISPLYLFQYLQYIRNDLVAYNIGSVQPSIKVTHIIKHPIFVPEENRIKEFDKLARTFTDQIYKLYCECENLKGIRDGLLPKLMSGELDVSELDI